MYVSTEYIIRSKKKRQRQLSSQNVIKCVEKIIIQESCRRKDNIIDRWLFRYRPESGCQFVWALLGLDAASLDPPPPIVVLDHCFLSRYRISGTGFQPGYLKMSFKGIRSCC
jgi:hypothetical protein